ncbi:MAG: 6-hydroxymethylpterin diphosphokinase MptE-like protein, partial [Spirochaetota bacterium]
MKKIEYRIETARSSNSIVVVKSNGISIPLNSRLDPVREGGKFSYELDPQKYSLLIILGCSLGYNLISVKEILSEYKNVIIIDILEGIENEISRNLHTSFLVESRNIHFFSGKDISSVENILENEIDFNIITGVQVIEHGTSVRVFNEYYSNVKNIVKRLIDLKARNSSTVKAFGKVFLRNAVNNINNFNRVSPVCRLKNRFKGASALIVSSAPSVEEYMDQINMLSDHCFIIAVDSALPMLLQKGINADFAISIDPQPRIFEHFLGQMKGNISFIFSIVSPPELLRRYGG